MVPLYYHHHHHHPHHPPLPVSVRQWWMVSDEPSYLVNCSSCQVSVSRDDLVVVIMVMVVDIRSSDDDDDDNDGDDDDTCPEVLLGLCHTTQHTIQCVLPVTQMGHKWYVPQPSVHRSNTSIASITLIVPSTLTFSAVCFSFIVFHDDEKCYYKIMFTFQQLVWLNLTSFFFPVFFYCIFVYKVKRENDYNFCVFQFSSSTSFHSLQLLPKRTSRWESVYPRVIWTYLLIPLNFLSVIQRPWR